MAETHNNTDDPQSTDSGNRVPPLNMTAEERGTLIHCIVAGEKAAVDHFGEDEAKRIESLKEKLGYPTHGGSAKMETELPNK